jgi:DNA-directed RNA polymerase specialized sigma subunit
VFDTGTDYARFDREEESALVARAKEGEDEAIHALILAYAPLFRSIRKRYELQLGDEIRGLLLEAMWIGIRDFDLDAGDRLGYYIQGPLLELLHEASESISGITVPSRLMRRYTAILNIAEHDLVEAARIAPDHHMSPEIFWSIWAATSRTVEIDDHLDSYAAADQYQGVLDHYLADIALRALEGRELQVVQLHYGFLTLGDPLSDSEVAEWIAALGQKRVSLRTVIDTRHRAIRNCRRVLGVES